MTDPNKGAGHDVLVELPDGLSSCVVILHPPRRVERLCTGPQQGSSGKARGWSRRGLWGTRFRWWHPGILDWTGTEQAPNQGDKHNADVAQSDGIMWQLCSYPKCTIIKIWRHLHLLFGRFVHVNAIQFGRDEMVLKRRDEFYCGQAPECWQHAVDQKRQNRDWRHDFGSW